MEDKKKNLEQMLYDLLTNKEMTPKEISNFVQKVLEDYEADPINIDVGWFAFAGGKFSPDPSAFDDLFGVVAWVNPDKRAPKGERVLILMPNAKPVEKWSNKIIEAKISDEQDGAANTKDLISFGWKHRMYFPAVEWCFQYCRNGVTAGTAFLPANKQWQKIVPNADVINRAMFIIDGVPLRGKVLSSTEYGTHFVWSVDTGSGSLCLEEKDNLKALPRCLVAW